MVLLVLMIPLFLLVQFSRLVLPDYMVMKIATWHFVEVDGWVSRIAHQWQSFCQILPIAFILTFFYFYFHACFQISRWPVYQNCKHQFCLCPFLLLSYSVWITHFCFQFQMQWCTPGWYSHLFGQIDGPIGWQLQLYWSWAWCQVFKPD